MKDNILWILEYISKSSFIKSCLIEIIKAAVTFLFGYFSFNVYQRYKNKKDNNKLYVQFLKLEKEMKANIDLICKYLDEYIMIEVLSKQFNINGNQSNELLQLYKYVNQISIYENQSPIYDENGEVEDIEIIYCEKPYRIIADYENDIYLIEEDYHGNFEELSGLRNSLEFYETKNIFEDLIDLENKANNLLQNKFELSDEIKFLHQKLSKFNKLSKVQKNKYLTKFCELILTKENQFTNSLSNYNTMINLKSKLDSTKSALELDVKFNMWKEIEGELLAVYNAELYLDLEEVYTLINNSKIYINRKDTLEIARNLIVEKLGPLITKNKEHLKRILIKTNKLFKHI